MIFEFKSPDGKTYEVEGPEGSSPEDAFKQLQAHLATDTTNTHFNRARVAGTGAVQGVTDVARLPYHLAQGADDVLAWLGVISKEKRDEMQAFRQKNLPSVTEKVESIGIPTNPEAEAKRLGVRYDDTLKAITAGTRTAAGTAVMGGGILPSILAGAGAGTGQAVGGDEGELIGALAGPLVAGKLASRMAGRAQARAIPTQEHLYQQADDAFAAMRQAGAVVSPAAMRQFASGVGQDLTRQSYRGALNPNTRTVLRELNNDIRAATNSGGMQFDQLHQFRRVIDQGASLAAPGSTDARYLSRIRTRLNSFLSNLSNAQVVSGNPIAASTALRAGTAAYRRAATSEEIAALMERARNNAAGFSQTGMDKAVRDQFRSLANSPRRMRLFTPPEQAQIRMIARSTRPMNLLRFFGGMSPKGALTGVAHAANIAANPLVGLPLAGALSGARVAATRSRLNAVRDLDELIRAGTQMHAPPVLPLALPGLGAAGATYLSGQ